MTEKECDKDTPKTESRDAFRSALEKVAKASAASSRAAIEASKLTKPSRHTRFVYNPSKGRA
jgi:hypothetical protein